MTDAGVPVALRRFLEATNAEDPEALLTAFTEDAVVDDFGRTFAGHAEIAGWSDRENIGTHNRIRVTGVRGLEVAISVTGDGYNGPGTFAVQLDGDLMSRLTIRA